MNKTDVPIREKNTLAIGEASKCFSIENGYTKQEHASHESQYFVMGNNRIIINEHFRNDGKPLGFILERVILEAGNNQKTA